MAINNSIKEYIIKISTRTSTKILFFASTFLVVSILLLTYITVPLYPEAQTISKNIQSFQELETRFSKLAKRKGGVYAFKILERASLPPQTDMHLLGHAIGGVLYQQKGVGGISVCTSDFRNACSHTIVIGALAEFGEGALPKIKEACKEAPGGPGAYTMCFHGLGHGVFAGYGYDLPKTVAFCKRTGTKKYHNQEYTECFGGAMMELTGGGGHSHNLWEAARKKYLKRPLDPCMTDVVPDDVKEMCLVYLTPELWKDAGIQLGNPDPNLYTKAFKYCDTIPKRSAKLREACYGGFGKEFVPIAALRDTRALNNFSARQSSLVFDWCKKANVPEGIRACVDESIRSLFWGGENNPRSSFEFCKVVSTTSKKYGDACYTQLSKEIQRYILKDGKKQELCKRLPKQIRTLCK